MLMKVCYEWYMAYSLRNLVVGPAVGALLVVSATAGCSSPDETEPDSRIIVADANVWSWVPFDDAFCGTGTTTGLGINPSDASDELLIYFQGGGVCYDQNTCLGPDPGASNVDGFGPTEFAEFTGENGVEGIFDRSDAANPFRDFDFVFVPYCTGDVHIGNNVPESIGLNFVGQKNVEAYLGRLVPTFATPSQLVLTGSSAGGFGAMYNFYMVEKAFAPAPATMIDDSGPFLPLMYTPTLLALVSIFGLQGTIPPGCAKCLDATDMVNGGLHNLIPYYAETLPGRRISLLSSKQDQTIADNFMLTGAALEMALDDIASSVAPTNPDFRFYYLAGTDHTWLTGSPQGPRLGDVTSGGVGLESFLAQQISGDAAWANVQPPP